MSIFRLSEKEMNYLADKYPTPFLVASLDKIEENYNVLRQNLPRVRVHYAMKANPMKRIVERLASWGACYDVASAGEIEQLHAMGVSGERIIYANPVKTKQGLELSAKYGINRFTFDDESEIDKMAAYVPGGEVLVRIRVSNDKALVNLNAKFGVAPAEALELLRKAKEAGLVPAGVCFHVGSQSLTTEAYEEALLVCRRIFNEAAAEGMELKVLDIGGGFPIPSVNGPVDPAGMMQAISRQLDRLFPDTELLCEPGRFMCGTAVNLVTSIIGTKTRGDQTWYVLDEGLYGTFSGAIFDHWTFEFESFRRTKKYLATFVGPSCDSIDFVRRDVMTPELKMGDRLLVPDCGAYTSASSTTFNGFQQAPIYIYEELAVPKEQSAEASVQEAI